MHQLKALIIKPSSVIIWEDCRLPYCLHIQPQREEQWSLHRAAPAAAGDARLLFQVRVKISSQHLQRHLLFLSALPPLSPPSPAPPPPPPPSYNRGRKRKKNNPCTFTSNVRTCITAALFKQTDFASVIAANAKRFSLFASQVGRLSGWSFLFDRRFIISACPFKKPCRV